MIPFFQYVVWDQGSDREHDGKERVFLVVTEKIKNSSFIIFLIKNSSHIYIYIYTQGE